jgi:hypothetical protein
VPAARRPLPRLFLVGDHGRARGQSRLELARLLLADFDRHVTAIAALPFLLQARAGVSVMTVRWMIWRFEATARKD